MEIYRKTYRSWFAMIIIIHRLRAVEKSVYAVFRWNKYRANDTVITLLVLLHIIWLQNIFKQIISKETL